MSLIPPAIAAVEVLGRFAAAASAARDLPEVLAACASAAARIARGVVAEIWVCDGASVGLGGRSGAERGSANGTGASALASRVVASRAPVIEGAAVGLPLLARGRVQGA